ncbi:MFS transporter, partial [Streptomyces arenae]|nr:MFS transporter [Streptomyces arenae]
MTDELRRGRASLAFAFLVQGVTFALLVTRIPAIQDRYGISDGLLPVFLAAVPILAGVGSVATEQLVKRVPPSAVLRWSQPVVLLALLGVGAGDALWQVAVALGVFGLAVGALDASMNMLGVSLQRAYGRSIMLGFHAAYSLGGIVGASLAWAGAHWDLSLFVSYLPVVVVLLPAALVGSRWYVDAAREDGVGAAGEGQGGTVVFRMLLPLCLVMSFAYIGDATVSNWSAKYLQDVLGSSEELSTVPYNVYMVMTLVGRGLG